MKKIILVIVFALAGLTVITVSASDQQFRQMEEKKIFDKIRTKMIIGCYTQGKKLQSQVNSLEQLKALYPRRTQVCACFQAALVRVPDRTIYEDSKHSSQLYARKKEALKLHDKARLKEVEVQIQAFEPFLTKIIRKCGLSSTN